MAADKHGIADFVRKVHAGLKGGYLRNGTVSKLRGFRDLSALGCRTVRFGICNLSVNQIC